MQKVIREHVQFCYATSEKYLLSYTACIIHLPIFSRRCFQVSMINMWRHYACCEQKQMIKFLTNNITKKLIGNIQRF